MRQLSNTECQEIVEDKNTREDRLGDINDHLPFLLERLYEELNVDNLDISTEDNAKATLVAINKMIQSLNVKKDILNRLV